MNNQEALAAAVSGEDAAIYAYGVIGALLNAGARRRALEALRAHQSWRDRMAHLMPGDTAPAPGIAYDFPMQVIDAGTTRALAQLVENRLVVVYADLAATCEGEQRADAVLAASECANRAVIWGAPSQAFPHDASLT
ncbi:MAG: ferritin-like domain-containing protein [Actinobacteria bacterium]|nr:ferritin-like domain-containing protein [Actinomycetota bacterium]